MGNRKRLLQVRLLSKMLQHALIVRNLCRSVRFYKNVYKKIVGVIMKKYSLLFVAFGLCKIEAMQQNVLDLKTTLSRDTQKIVRDYLDTWQLVELDECIIKREGALKQKTKHGDYDISCDVRLISPLIGNISLYNKSFNSRYLFNDALLTHSSPFDQAHSKQKKLLYIWLLDMRQLEAKKEITEHLFQAAESNDGDSISSIVMSVDKKLWAIYSDYQNHNKRVTLLNTVDQSVITIPVARSIQMIAISPDNNLIALTFDRTRTVEIYDTKTGKLVCALKDCLPEQHHIRYIAFINDGATLVALFQSVHDNKEKTILFFDLQSQILTMPLADENSSGESGGCAIM